MTKKDIREYLASIGRKGGLKSGAVRLDKISPEERSAIAKNAAESRWKDHVKKTKKKAPAKKRAAAKKGA